MERILFNVIHDVYSNDICKIMCQISCDILWSTLHTNSPKIDSMNDAN